MMASSTMELTLICTPAGSPALALRISVSIRSISPDRTERGATKSRLNVDFGA